MTAHARAQRGPSEPANADDGRAADPADPAGASAAPRPATDDGTTPVVDAAADLAADFARELAEARRAADESHDRYLRAVAELQNVKRRSEERLQAQID